MFLWPHFFANLLKSSFDTQRKYFTNIERGYPHLMSLSPCFRILSGTICLFTANSSEYRTRGPGSRVGGWSILTPPRRGSHHGDELLTLTMVSFFASPPHQHGDGGQSCNCLLLCMLMILSFYCSLIFLRHACCGVWRGVAEPRTHCNIVHRCLILMSFRFLLQ